MSDETMSDAQQNELLFMQLVMMFQGMAMQQLGKVMNPMTQQIDRDLGQAKNFIDLLSMIEKKTQNNLSDNEQKLLQQALFDLRMNYVDEVKKENASSDTESSDKDDTETGTPEADADTPETDAAETDASENEDDGEDKT